MYPELFSIGKITIYTYGVLVALGFFMGMQYIVKYSKNIITKQQVYDFLFYVILIGIIGARLFYVMLDIPYYKSNPLEIFQVWKGGLVYYGGFVAVLIFAFFYCRYKKINIVKLIDVFAPALALGHAFGRIGCFFAGCCYGAPSEKYGVYFDALGGAPQGVKLFPIQLVEAGINFVVFAVLMAGYALGRITVKGISLGDAGVFIVALLAGALFFHVNDF